MSTRSTASEVVSLLLHATAITIVGASDNGAKASGRTMRYLRKYGYKGDIYPVNPSRETVQGEPAYASIEQLPAVPDVAVIVLPKAAVAAAIEACGAKGIRFAIVFAAGYAEVGAEGAQEQAELAAVAERAGVRFLGPNSVGAVMAAEAVTTAFMTGLDQDRFALRDDGVAFVSQSGAMGGFVLNMAQSDGLGVGRFFSTGNEADLALGELMEGLVDEGSTRAMLAYVEGVRDGEAFCRALEKAQRARVPVVLMKVGRSERGAVAAASHTGALAGSDAVLDGILERYGAQRAEDVEQLVDFGRVFAANRIPRGRKVSIMTISGGAGVLMTDYAEDLGLDVFEWDQPWQRRMAEILPMYAPVSNPIDTTGAIAADQQILTDGLQLCLDNPETDIAIVLLGNLEMEEDGLCDRIIEVAAGSDKPILVAWVGGSGNPRRILSSAGVPTFTDPVRAMRAAAALADWALAEPPAPSPAGPSSELSVLKDRLAAMADDGVSMLHEMQSKKVLAQSGIPVTREIEARSPAEARAAADEIGLPVVLKLLSDEVEHKSDIGGVKLGLADLDAVEDAAAEVLAIADRLELTERSVVVQESVTGGAELILGATHDPTFGPVVVVGLGGIFTEVLRDVAMRPAPIDPGEARRMVASLRGVALLRGTRGLPVADESRLAAAISDFSRAFAEISPAVESIDVNPLVITGSGGVMALDGVVTLKNKEEQR
ncbi:acetate--CoA ligase family protein [Aeromicrobium endophyticum]|uniref:acetate--CoA ligase family protein n=1 Tax=Aeromicrobium endophyticum TaxID=2292704 RepID=UPI0013140C8F|nr:acetate--CoA ligase family protein [Aeromicrobium endophyticum]